MLVYRVSKFQYCRDISGEGAKKYGGRWNHISIPCIYTSSSRALALLEYSVNVNLHFIPQKLYFTVFDIDEEMVTRINLKKLPENWYLYPSSNQLKDLGSSLLIKNDIKIIQVPSAVVQKEFNFLINPLVLKPKIKDIEEFEYDSRIKTV